VTVLPWRDDPAICPVCDGENCEEHVVERPTRGDSRASTLTFLHAVDVMREPRPVEIIEGIAWAGRLTVLVSESGGSKTFTMQSIAASVSDGVSWQGRAVLEGSVAYLSYEGDAHGLRLRALHEVGGHRLDHVYVLRAHDPLSPLVGRDGEERSIGERAVAAAVEALADELRAANRPPIRLIVIDTARASLAGSEDNSEHVAAYLRAVRRLMALAPDAALILAHHSGWQDGENQRKRERGSSAWRGNCDATLYLEASTYDADRGEAELILSVRKVRDAEQAAPLHLIRRRVDLLETDRRGEPVTSCLIERDRRSRNDREAEQAAAVEATCSAIDLTVLRAMRDYPTATSIARLRPYVGFGSKAVTDAVARILRANLVVEGRRGQPFTLTEAGLARLNSGAEI
jgi:RecA-family ATPase